MAAATSLVATWIHSLTATNCELSNVSLFAATMEAEHKSEPASRPASDLKAEPEQARRPPSAEGGDLAPNGLPYSRCPPAVNEWSKRSPLLARLPHDHVGTMHPFIVCRPRSDVGGGLGLFASFGLRAGEVVWAERSKAGPEAGATAGSTDDCEAGPDAGSEAGSETGPGQLRSRRRG